MLNTMDGCNLSRKRKKRKKGNRKKNKTKQKKYNFCLHFSFNSQKPNKQ